jgi:hypothetical protein
MVLWGRGFPRVALSESLPLGYHISPLRGLEDGWGLRDEGGRGAITLALNFPYVCFALCSWSFFFAFQISGFAPT